MAINYSSGTPARPKVAMYTHRGAYLNALGEIIHQRFDLESVYLWTLPMFHCSGWVHAVGGDRDRCDARMSAGGPCGRDSAAASMRSG